MLPSRLVSAYADNNSDCGDKPRDFSLIDFASSSPDSLACKLGDLRSLSLQLVIDEKCQTSSPSIPLIQHQHNSKTLQMSTRFNSRLPLPPPPPPPPSSALASVSSSSQSQPNFDHQFMLIEAPKEFSATADGQSTRREPNSYYSNSANTSSTSSTGLAPGLAISGSIHKEKLAQTSKEQRFHQAVLDRLKSSLQHHSTRQVNLNNNNNNNNENRYGTYSGDKRRRRLFEYSDTSTLKMNGQEALNDHYDKWTSNEQQDSISTPKTLSKCSNIYDIDLDLHQQRNVKKCSREIRTICTYIDYDSFGNQNTSRYSMKMNSTQTTLRRFKNIMPHPVKQPRFFFRNSDNELVEIDEDDQQLPIVCGRTDESLIVCEIISRLI